MTAARSFLSQAKRNTTFLCLPDCRVDGAAPARHVSDSASGNRALQSTKSTEALGTRLDRRLDPDDLDRLDVPPHVAELFCSLPGWQRYGNRIEKTFNFDDFSAATRFVGRMAGDAAVAGRQPAIDLRCDRVTVAFAPRDGSTLTREDVAVASRIQRLVGDHRHPVGQAGPWSPRGTLAGIRPCPVGQAGP
jgi:pterin-4a-carbinolamine dehydratase